MNEDALNMSVRKFLKTVGVTAQREIEGAVRTADAVGRLSGKGPLRARCVVTVDGIDLEFTVEGEIAHT